MFDVSATSDVKRLVPRGEEAGWAVVPGLSRSVEPFHALRSETLAQRNQSLSGNGGNSCKHRWKTWLFPSNEVIGPEGAGS